jgi:hypothetical protein
MARFRKDEVSGHSAPFWLGIGQRGCDEVSRLGIRLRLEETRRTIAQAGIGRGQKNPDDFY